MIKAALVKQGEEMPCGRLKSGGHICVEWALMCWNRHSPFHTSMHSTAHSGCQVLRVWGVIQKTWDWPGVRQPRLREIRVVTESKALPGGARGSPGGIHRCR